MFVVANQKGPLLVYKNTVTPENEWIEFELEGTSSNRSAIGRPGHPVLERTAAGAGSFRRQWLRLQRTSDGLHFGLGKYPQIEKVVIRWPSGKLQAIDKPAAGQLHKIKEPA
jgi:hypothetical protein